MPDNSPPPHPVQLGFFEPKALRMMPGERDLVGAFMDRVLAAHPAWPWPLIEEEARRRAEEILTGKHP